MTDEQRDLLLGIVRRVLQRDDVSKDAPLRDAGLDSMALFSLIEGLEETFRIEVREEEVLPRHFESLRALETYLAAKLGAGV
jgi:acyl carrier protein